MVYNTHLTVTYNKYEGDKSDSIYRKELMEVFNLEYFEIDVLNKKIETLYDLVKHDDELRKMCKENAGRMLSEDPVFGFMLCFSYDSFANTHELICKLLSAKYNTTAVIG